MAGSVRIRLTVAAVTVVGAALLAGALALVYALSASLTDDVRAGAQRRATELATAVEAGPGQEWPSGTRFEAGELAQILDADGDVVAASARLAGQPPLVRVRPSRSAEIEVDEEDHLAVTTLADTASGRFTVIVARPLVDVLESTRLVTSILVIGLPLLLGLVAFTTWHIVGRALSAVEAIRGEVDEITAAGLNRRVPEAGGTDEIGRLAATMNLMLDRLERAQASQRRFISDASHELRSPVASIRQHAEVALAHPETTTTADLAENVLAEDLRVQRLVDDLLLLARADEESLQLARRPVDVDDLVFDEGRHLRATTKLRIDTTGVSAGRVDGDAIALRRVLRNLGENSARHARESVAFALAERGDHVVLTVDDDGPGIPEADRGRILERFVRLADARSRDEGGSGLGLAIVAELVTAHGGDVAISESDLGGARVEVTLPASGIDSAR